MSRSKTVILTLTLWISLTMCPQVVCGQNGKEEAGVTIELTKLDVNDTTLELSYKIKNNTEHDVWICDDVDVYFASLDFEVYLSEDEQTLLIRRRFDVPTDAYWPIWPSGHYVLLPSGQERTESLSLDVPVHPRPMFVYRQAASDHARRLVLEIGFYNEDLPGMIREILEMAEKLNCARLEPSEYRTPFFIRYFKGIWIAHQLFGGLSGFEEHTYQEGNEEITIPYTRQNLNGEQVLRLEVDGVSIPYEDEEVPAAEEPANDKVEDTPITLALTKLDVNDTNLELSWKIKNDTDHDVWVCDRYSMDFEQFMDKDAKTLVLRRRYNLSNEGVLWEFPFPRFRYSRLRPDQEKVESLSLTVPVRPWTLFSSSRGNAESAKRLAIEIGFYDEDLPELILNIVEMAERLSCDGSAISLLDPNSNWELYNRFFGGVSIAQYFNSENFTYFRDSVTSGGDEIIIPYLWQTLNGEQILRIEVDGVSIPYKGYIPLTGHTEKRTGDEQSQLINSP